MHLYAEADDAIGESGTWFRDSHAVDVSGGHYRRINGEAGACGQPGYFTQRAQSGRRDRREDFLMVPPALTLPTVAGSHEPPREAHKILLFDLCALLCALCVRFNPAAIGSGHPGVAAALLTTARSPLPQAATDTRRPRSPAATDYLDPPRSSAAGDRCAFPACGCGRQF